VIMKMKNKKKRIMLSLYMRRMKSSIMLFSKIKLLALSLLTSYLLLLRANGKRVQHELKSSLTFLHLVPRNLRPKLRKGGSKELLGRIAKVYGMCCCFLG
jgi:hypothetical protein